MLGSDREGLGIGLLRVRVRVRDNWSPIWTRSPIWSYQFWHLLNSDCRSEPNTVLDLFAFTVKSFVIDKIPPTVRGVIYCSKAGCNPDQFGLVNGMGMSYRVTGCIIVNLGSCWLYQYLCAIVHRATDVFIIVKRLIRTEASEPQHLLETRQSFMVLVIKWTRVSGVCRTWWWRSVCLSSSCFLDWPIRVNAAEKLNFYSGRWV